MESFKLDKRVVTNTDYYTESDTALIIQAVGTNDTARVTAKVEGQPCLEIIADMAGLYTVAANRLPLLDLGDLYIVVPPDKVFRFDGTGSTYVRIKGSILRLAPGEVTPAGFLARYTEQGKKYIDYFQGAEGSDTTLAEGSSTKVLDETCPAGEKWTFNNLYMAKLLKQTGPAVDYGLHSRVKVQDVPKDNLIQTKLVLGITQYATPYPPDDTLGNVPFSFKDKPFELKPGQVLLIEAVCATSASIDFDDTSKALIVGVKEYL